MALSKATKALLSLLSKPDIQVKKNYKFDRKVVNALIKMPEHRMFFRTLSSWVGYKSTSVTYDVARRAARPSGRKRTFSDMPSLQSQASPPIPCSL